MNKVVFLLCCSVVAIASCQREAPPEERVPGTWRLSAAELHMENMDTRQWTRYTYFNDTLTVNCLDIDGCTEVLDSIEKDQTTWEITTSGVTVNGWKQYEHQGVYPSLRIFPTADGSARVYLVDHASESRLVLSGRETYESLGDTNYHYYSTLYFNRIR